ncbi:MAG: zf-HC2 domain-containing protein [Deltaproteobacteria bacterium]|nr:MAG: zf-HC2 domain-containing protein [Deltaproteobacteria bacterium]
MTSPIHHCKECVDLLGEYVEGVLPPDRAKALEDHLSTCPPCITFVRTYRATRKLCRNALATEMPKELMSSLSSFLGDRRRSKTRLPTTDPFDTTHVAPLPLRGGRG